MSKVKIIVEAVNYFRGNNQKSHGDGARKDDELLILRTINNYRVAGVQRYKGKLITGGIGFNDECCEIICTKNEFNQCVKEMSQHNVTQEKFDAYVAADKEVLKPVFNEWKNGDECVYNGNSNCFVIGWLPSAPMVVIETNEMEIEAVMFGDISRPETQEQKYARERIASGVRLWRAINYNDTVSDERIIKLERFKDYLKAIDDGFSNKKDS